MVKVIKEKKSNPTDVHLQVKSLSNYEIYDWDSAKIVSALREECRLSKADAEKIAETVYGELVSMGKTEIDIQTLKTMVNYHLLKNGFNGAKLSGQVSVGMSLYDLDNLIHEKSAENSNISSNNPEAIALTVAENTFKKYALKKVFAGDVERAHLEGLIHLHDMGCITRVYCSAHSVRAIAMHGLGQFLKFDVRSSPAKHAQVLVGHLNTFLCSAATYYAGALGLDFVNIYFAPYVEHMSDKEMKQVAQYLIFSLSQSAFSRGGQVLFTDFNVHISIPEWLKKVQAVGPGGEMLTKKVDGKVVPKTYADFEVASKKFLRAMMEVWREGDSNGAPFSFPKCFDKETPLYAKVDGVVRFLTAGDILSICGRKNHEVYLPRLSAARTMEWVRVRGAMSRGEEIGVRVRLNNGAYQDSTKDHKYYVWDENCISERMAQDIRVGDVMLFSSPVVDRVGDYQKIDVFGLLDNPDYQVFNVVKSSNSMSAVRDGWCRRSECLRENLTADSFICGSKQKKNSLPVEIILDEKFAKLLGYFASEGSFSGNRLNVAAINGGRCREKIEALLSELGFDYGGDNASVYIYNKLLVDLVSMLFVDYGVVSKGYRPASSKHVPSYIFNSPVSVRKEFLVGLFSGDGCVKKYGFGFSSSSRSLVYGCKWLLESVGVYSSVYEESRNGYDCVYYSLSIKGSKSVSLANEFLSEEMGSCSDFGRRENSEASWYNSVPVSCFGDGTTVCDWEKNSRQSMSLDDERIIVNPLLSGMIPVVVKSVGDVEVDAIAIEVDCPEHDFVTGDGTWTKNCDFHLSEKDFTENKDIVMEACQIASENGSPYFIFDHDSITVSACCRLRTKIEDEKVLEEPERLRFCGFQNVTINLPQCAYRSNGDWKLFEKEIANAMELSKKAHLQKKKFIESISQNPGDPMYDLCGASYFDGKPYVHLPSCTYIIGMIGLNEAVKFMLGQEIHESDEAFEKGKDIVAYMLAVLGKIKKETGLKFTLEESPAESTARRLARCDVGKYEVAKKFVNGSLEDDNIYYTNCVSDDTEILTEDGWKFRKDVRVGDNVLTLNMNDKLLYYQPVLRKFEQSLKNAKMVSIKGKATDQLVTPNHNILYTNLAKKDLVNLTTYKNLPSTFRVFCAAPVACGDNGKYSDDLLALLGWIISEGHYGKKGNFMTIAQSEVANKKKYDEIESLLTRLGFDYQINHCKQRGNIAFRLKKKDSDFVRSLFPKRRIPREILNTCSVRQLMVLLDAALKGDGTRRFSVRTQTWNEQATYYSADRGIIEDVQEVLLKIGFRSNIIDCPSSSTYQIRATKFNTTELNKKQHVSEEEYTGMVWCVEVENHTFVARRKDKVFITGNSIHFRPDADIPFVDRVFKQSEFHNMIESGAIVHMFCGEHLPDPESLFALLEKVFRTTNCAQLVVSPEFTVCHKCGRFPGLKEACPKCGATDVDRITRVVGYYSKVDNWNVSKQREGLDRHNGVYSL